MPQWKNAGSTDTPRGNGEHAPAASRPDLPPTEAARQWRDVVRLPRGVREIVVRGESKRLPTLESRNGNDCRSAVGANINNAGKTQDMTNSYLQPAGNSLSVKLPTSTWADVMKIDGDDFDNLPIPKGLMLDVGASPEDNRDAIARAQVTPEMLNQLDPSQRLMLDSMAREVREAEYPLKSERLHVSGSDFSCRSWGCLNLWF